MHSFTNVERRIDEGRGRRLPPPRHDLRREGGDRRHGGGGEETESRSCGPNSDERGGRTKATDCDSADGREWR